MNEMVDCKIPIRFPLKPNSNGVCFSKEAFENIEQNLKDMPIIKNGNVLGILVGTFESVENEEVITIFADGIFFSECYPEIKVLEKENNKITSFEFLGTTI